MNKIYSYFLFLLFVCTYLCSNAQTYGNEWIKYDQQYYGFNVYPATAPSNFGDQTHLETGIYILDYSKLANSGIPITSILSENIQIFGKEKEIPLYINDGGDNSIDPGDYILFYTQRNDGWLDSMLYKDPNTIGNPYRSLYSDTLEYYFTWNNSNNNLRFSDVSALTFASYSPSDYILYTRWRAQSQEYSTGERNSGGSSSFFTSGEGWSRWPTECVNGILWGASAEITQV